MINFLNNFNFNSIVPNHLVTSPCPDQLVGYVTNRSYVSYQARTNIDYVLNSNNKHTVTNQLTNPIVIILESPHIHEYDPITNMAIGPAYGNTGKYFKLYFGQILSQTPTITLPNTRCDVILLNAVQYQCSLGLPLNGTNNKVNKNHRDNIFNSILSNHQYCDLIERINAINPCVIMNLCTKSINNLQNLVEQLLINSTAISPNIPRYRGYHPYNWNISNRRIIS